MKLQNIEQKFRDIMLELGLDLTDDSLIKTPHRVAKMFVNEIFYGLDQKKMPVMMTIENKFKYDQMLIEKNIKVNSVCEHHFLPIIGKCHIAYIPKDRVLGLSKFNRLVDFYSRRPQVQERLTNDIIKNLKTSLETDDIAVVIDAEHFCVKMRGIQDQETITRTSALSGRFKDDLSCRNEFFQSIGKI